MLNPVILPESLVKFYLQFTRKLKPYCRKLPVVDKCLVLGAHWKINPKAEEWFLS